jgi:CrcB-like protein
MSILSTLLFISSGAALGACLRWGLSVVLNPLFAAFSFGTLIANYAGCFIIGALFALFWFFPQISEEWKLFLVTGFLGSLTTFSSFSIEVVNNLFNGKFGVGIGLIAAHVMGSLLFTLLGLLLVRYALK